MSDDPPGQSNSSYTDRQTQHDREYTAAWENAPVEFRKQAAMLGIHCDVPDSSGMALEYNDNYTTSAYSPDMAETLDDIVDKVIEEFAHDELWKSKSINELVRAIYAKLRVPMEQELIRSRANLLGRVSCYLVQDEKGNLKARVHALLHSIPRLAAENGFPSMRASAKVCGVSPEWLRRKRDSWCDLLELERPANGTKSDEAKLKYKQNALVNHWRNQTYKAQNNGNNGKYTNGNGLNGHH